jgi:hypothetical protein
MAEELNDAVRVALKDVQDLIRVGVDGTVEYRLTTAVERVVEAVAPLLWLHAEAVHWREFESAAAESAEEDNNRLRLENKRLQRQLEFEMYGGDNFSEADARTLAEAVPQCAVNPEGETP